MALPLGACSDDNEPDDELIIDPVESAGVYIVNRGQYYNHLDGTLTMVDLIERTTFNNVFADVNKRSLGASPNGIAVWRDGGEIYIAVSESNTIEVCDMSGKSIKQITLGTSVSQPREIVIDEAESKAYISMFDGYVARMDCRTREMEDAVAVGPNPEGMDIKDGKLYVAISGGMNYMTGDPYDNRIAVVDLKSFTLEKHITTGTNPTVVKCLGNDIYTLCMGDYSATSVSQVYKTTNGVSAPFAPATIMGGNAKGIYAINAPFMSPDPITYTKFSEDGSATSFVAEGEGVDYPVAVGVSEDGLVCVTSCYIEYGYGSYNIPGYYNIYDIDGHLTLTGATGIDPYMVTFK